MLKHFLFTTVLFLCLDFGAYSQSYSKQIEQIPITENNNTSLSELNRYLDSVELLLSSKPIGKFIEQDVPIDLFSAKPGKNHQQSSWKIKTQNLGTRVFFDILQLGKGDSLFTYSIDGNLLEITTKSNHNGNSFTSAYGLNGLVFQLKNYSKASQIHISGYSLEKYSKSTSSPQDFGESENCQVNVNCSEGDDFRKIQKSVVRILMKVGNSFLWCTGTVMNNTNYDFEPYILSAEHCGLLGTDIAPQSDLDNWTFFFNYESEDCENPLSEVGLNQQRLTGARVIANSNDIGGDFGSDFLLLKLSDAIPNSFNAYYSGWNRQGLDFPEKGVGIHHPSGDLKKISTYHFPAISGSFGNEVNGTHWVVNWSATFNGFGTTEPGSSGSPLFDENNLFRGVLTGGAAGCNNLSGEDLYGKLSYSWNSNGLASNRRLDIWLDPLNTGYFAINGAFEGDAKPGIQGDLLEIYPVPAWGGFIKIKNIGKPQESLSISIFSVQGKHLLSSDIIALPGEDYHLDLKNWSQGVYIIKINQNGLLVERKFVISSTN